MKTIVRRLALALLGAAVSGALPGAPLAPPIQGAVAAGELTVTYYYMPG